MKMNHEMELDHGQLSRFMGAPHVGTRGQSAEPRDT